MDTTADALFVVMRSSWLPDTMNVLVNGPPTVGRIVKVIVADAELDKFPRLQATVPDVLTQLLWKWWRK